MENPKVVSRVLIFCAISLGAISVVASLYLNSFLPLVMYISLLVILATISIINASVVGPIMLLVDKLFSDKPKSTENDKTP
jgi:hypothetical protein